MAEDAKLPRPTRRGRWTSFIADPPDGEGVTRNLHEQGNPRHRLRVEHDGATLLIHPRACGSPRRLKAPTATFMSVDPLK